MDNHSLSEEELEDLRLRELAAYKIFGTSPEPVFDDLAEIVRIRFDVPIAIVSFVGQTEAHFKSHLGVELESAPRLATFCEQTIHQEKPVIVYDARNDDRYRDNPFVTGPPYVQFYAGVRIVTPTGVAIGAVSALDTIPRSPGKSDVEFMVGIARLVMNVLEMRRSNGTFGAKTRKLSTAAEG